MGFSYLILQFITCAPTTPYLLVSNNTCYDYIPERYFIDGYNELQSCLYDCYTCTNNTQCTQCNATTDFRTMNTTDNRCIPLTGYYDNIVTTAVACITPCFTCTSVTACLSCVNTTYLLGTSCLSCMSNCEFCNSSSNCQTCSNYYAYNGSSC